MLPVRLGVGIPAALAVCASLASAPAAAIDIEFGPPRENGGYVWIDLKLRDVLTPRIEETLSRGMPATLQFQVELWRSRAAWFDRLESSFDASIKIRFDVWNGLYRLERQGQPAIAVSSIDSVRMTLTRPVTLPAGRVGQLQPGKRYYLVVAVTLKPLTVEDIQEGEGWLSGEVENKRRAGLGGVTAIPRSLFDAVRNFTGFGDLKARAFSEPFDLESLFPETR